jgi:imidazolonepropionase-like amidohydrolase
MRVLLNLILIALLAQSPGLSAAGAVRLVVTRADLVTGPADDVLRDSYIAVDESGRIASIGPAANAPAAPKVIDAGGRLVTAGFWNCHVHFTQPYWANAARSDAGQLRKFLARMLGRYGFTTALDAGSEFANTEALSYRLERGRVIGPRLLMTGGSFVSPGAKPGELEIPVVELHTPADAEQKLQWVLGRDIRAVKIFTGPSRDPLQTAAMPLEVVQAVTAQSHAEGIPVIAHSQRLEDLRSAVYGGVDVLAHTVPAGGRWTNALVAEMVRRGVGLVPTLQRWRAGPGMSGMPAGMNGRLEQVAVGQLAAFASAGGSVLFGTDVGLIGDYDPTREYALLAEADMDFAGVLAALTTGPSERFGDPGETGRLAPGQRGDLVILDGDPRRDLQQFAAVYMAVKEGRVIFDSKEETGQ